MNLALSDEQVFLREAARGALSRFKPLESAREALDGGERTLDLWPTAREAGWPGLLIGEAHGGAGLDAFDAMLVLGECGRVLAGVELLGHLPASAILDASQTGAAAAMLPDLATGEKRAAYLPACPPDDLHDGWRVDAAHGFAHLAPPAATAAGEGHVTVTGSFAFVPDAPGADYLVGVALLDGRPVGVAMRAGNDGVAVEPVRRYDATRSLGHVTLEGARAVLLEVPEEVLAGAWHLAQALIAAESIGSVESALEVSVQYAKERFTFGRAIGSYQAV
jgi:alkylation response protein AidB-like acyl-CoA dehydrogenase